MGTFKDLISKRKLYYLMRQNGMTLAYLKSMMQVILFVVKELITLDDGHKFIGFIIGVSFLLASIGTLLVRLPTCWSLKQLKTIGVEFLALHALIKILWAHATLKPRL